MQTNRRTWQSFDEMHAAAQQGEAAAQCYLGICYQTGQGVAQDYVEALRWYRRAADQNDAAAQCYLGFCYQSGLGVPQEYGGCARRRSRTIRRRSSISVCSTKPARACRRITPKP